MSTKCCLCSGETFLWILSSIVCHVFLMTSATMDDGLSSNVIRHRSDNDEMSNLRSTANRVLTHCQVICQVTFCWDLCERTAENGNRHSDRIFPRRRRRHAANIGPSSRDRVPSYASPTDASAAAAAAAEDISSGSGVGNESSLSSVSDDQVSGEQPRIESSSSVESSTSVRPVGRGGNGANIVMNITVTVEETETGLRSAVLEFQLISALNWINRTIVVHLASETCNLDPDYPHCMEPNRHRSYQFVANSNKWYRYGYRSPEFLMFNARYWTKVEIGKEESKEYYFTTPKCSRLENRNPRRCIGQFDIPTNDPPNPALTISILCAEYSGRLKETVSIDIQWKVDPRPNVRWNSSILVLRDKNPLLTDHTYGQEMRLNLMLDRRYEILVRAICRESEIIYRPLIFDASVDRLKRIKICPTAVPTVVPVATEGANAVLTGSIVVVSLSMIGLVFFVYRKYKRVRTNKKAISEANSYKSSPSGSLRLLREGQPFNTNVDEWEIDPREVSLGVEIGQGAFGRVLTGYYKNKEIAIKVLRENIPEFYREDLLREINLMKGIGYHPNIVTMLGACTVREPIALIVEYMPFGNLQTFLKKCRLDRETQAPDKRGELLYCLLDEMTGVKESWQIAPTDILSFARQVVLAMQYLADRHYVHRDLAARNVLLGNNKVVKVCDFGLARMVYAGDQYFKLTSGRLPLKWMALESIRDRVFTTNSDVWSFGVLLWEMVTLGASPYPGIALVDLYRLLSEGYRMQQPVNCSDELYDIISQCWCENPTDRPTFARIRFQLEALLARNVDYLDLDNIDIPLNHSGKDDDGETSSGVKDRLLSTHDNVCIY